ncbi:MAG: polyprenyl synthetase family protein [Actinomycetota bacterium]|nr:polyprenyl synthetase family protein [Actinomycetota bacterium]
MEPLSRDEVGAALEPIAPDLKRIEAVIYEVSAAATSFLTEGTTYLTKAGGKRLRPAVAVLGSRLGSGPNHHVDITAAAIEMVHLATLYHDDVIDEADMRRGVPSANEKWGNKVAILAGDYLFARASKISSEVGGDVPGALADAIAQVVQGQVNELGSVYDPRRSEEQYFTTIGGKTASLIEVAVRLGASLASCEPEVVAAMRRFGEAFGYAFQVADDLLDLTASEEELGKPPGTDLRDGVYTLPVIYAVEADSSLASKLGTPSVDVDAVREATFVTGAFERAMMVAMGYVEEALSALKSAPPSPARATLEQITRLVVDRVPVP